MRIFHLFTAAMLIACTAASARAASWNRPPKQKIAGLEHRTFRSASMNVDVGFNICLPPEAGREKDRRFPVVYYLHGYEGHESSYLDYVRFWRESLARTGPTILVLVNGGETSFFSDAPDGSIMGETVVVKELIPHLDQQFPTIPSAAGRSLHGYSMGGFGALKLAFKHPDMFGSVVAYGATLSTAAEMQKHLGKVYRQMFGGDAARFHASDPLALLQQNAAQLRGRVSVQLVIGTKDEFLAANRRLRNALDAARLDHSYREIPGAKHKKDALYETAAVDGFLFSAKAFRKEETAKPQGAKTADRKAERPRKP